MVWVVAVVVVVVVVDSFSVLFTTGHSRGFVSFRFVFLVCSLSASFCEHQTSKRQELHLLFPEELTVAKPGAYVFLNNMMQ